MAGRLNLKVHHGGKFSTGTPLTYDGGATTNYRNIEKASLSYSSLVDIAKDVGEGNNVKIYYIIPGFTLESGADLVPYNNEEAVTKMVSLSDGDAYLEIFFEENDQGVSENSPIVLESSVGDTMTKKKQPKVQIPLSTGKRDRRFWTPEEETHLVEILYSMNNTQWKVDTGHKTGYLFHVEKEMAKLLPNANIKGSPHIKSKVKTMKRQLGYIIDIQRNGSGFGWDDEKKMVLGEKDTFMGWAKSREGAAQLWMKPMPHFDKLVEIYAVDMANGSNARAPGDDKISHVDVGGGTIDLEEMEISSQPHNVADVNMGATQCEPQPSQACAKSGTNSQAHTRQSYGQPIKRKAIEVDPLQEDLRALSKSVTSFFEAEKENTNVFKNTLERDLTATHRSVHRLDNLYSVIEALGGGLTTEDVIQATRIISGDPTKVTIFFSMPDETTKLIFVEQELGHV